MPIQDYERIAKYVQDLGEPAVSVFDIGTRAIRILVAPRRVPPHWDRYTFSGASFEIDLGADVDLKTKTLKPGSKALEKLIHLVSSHIRNLLEAGVSEISLIGTAVFRWLENDESLRQLLKERTPVELQVIPEEFESQLTLRSVPEILQRNPMHGLEVGENDIIMMVDQGGGSLEVSWMKYAERHATNPNIRMRLSDELGTQKLRLDFFTRNGQYDDPSRNPTRISTQVDRIHSDALSTIRNWLTLPRASAMGERRLHVFAVGSGITNLWPKKRIWEKHGKVVTRERLNSELDELNELFGTNQQVLTVYKALTGQTGSGVEKGPWKDIDDLDEQLTKLYGLPVYLAVLEAVECDQLRVSGYGLRFGYYLDRYLRKAVEVDDSGPYVFASYSRINPHAVYDDLYQLSKAKCRLWYDHGIKPSADWNATIASKIAGASALLVYLTKQSIKSDPVYREVYAASALKKKIIPIIVDVAPEDIPPKFLTIWGPAQYIKWNGQDNEHLDALRAEIPAECFAAAAPAGAATASPVRAAAPSA